MVGDGVQVAVAVSVGPGVPVGVGVSPGAGVALGVAVGVGVTIGGVSIDQTGPAGDPPTRRMPLLGPPAAPETSKAVVPLPSSK